MTIEDAVHIMLPQVADPPAGFRARFPCLSLIVEWDGRDGPETLRRDVAQINRDLLHSTLSVDWLAIQTVGDVKAALHDAYPIPVRIYTEEEYEEIKWGREREALEELAVSIARKYACTVNTERFLAACNTEIANIRDTRLQIRRSGDPPILLDIHACTEKEIQIQRLLCWIEQNLPLLFARWEEAAR